MFGAEIGKQRPKPQLVHRVDFAARLEAAPFQNGAAGEDARRTAAGTAALRSGAEIVLHRDFGALVIRRFGAPFDKTHRAEDRLDNRLVPYRRVDH